MRKNTTKQASVILSISFRLPTNYFVSYTLFSVRLYVGEFKSNSRRVFRVEGSGLDIPFSVEHVIHYEECPFASLDNTTVLKLKVGRNFVTYDARELIVRFAMTNKISPLQGF